MIDFIIDMVADIADFFIDLWINKMLKKKKTVHNQGINKPEEGRV